MHRLAECRRLQKKVNASHVRNAFDLWLAGSMRTKEACATIGRVVWRYVARKRDYVLV